MLVIQEKECKFRNILKCFSISSTHQFIVIFQRYSHMHFNGSVALHMWQEKGRTINGCKSPSLVAIGVCFAPSLLTKFYASIFLFQNETLFCGFVDSSHRFVHLKPIFFLVMLISAHFECKVWSLPYSSVLICEPVTFFNRPRISVPFPWTTIYNIEKKSGHFWTCVY